MPTNLQQERLKRIQIAVAMKAPTPMVAEFVAFYGDTAKTKEHRQVYQNLVNLLSQTYPNFGQVFPRTLERREKQRAYKAAGRCTMVSELSGEFCGKPAIGSFGCVECTREAEELDAEEDAGW